MKPWTAKEVSFLIQQRSKNTSITGISRALKRSRCSIERKVRDLISRGTINKLESADSIIDLVSEFKQEQEPDFDKFLELSGDFISVSDVHVPYWNVGMFEKIFALEQKFKTGRLIVNGDFLNMDAFTSYCTPNRGREHSEREFTVADYVLAKCLKVFKEVVITMGNHEIRMFKALMGQVNPTRFMRMINSNIGKAIKISDYPYCVVDGKWLVGHPENFGGRGGQVPADLADKYQMNVICGHNHQFGVQMSLSGKFMGIDQGMGADGKKIEYNMKALNKYRVWQNGFTMVRGGMPYVFNYNFTDWKWWLR